MSQRSEPSSSQSNGPRRHDNPETGTRPQDSPRPGARPADAPSLPQRHISESQSPIFVSLSPDQLARVVEALAIPPRPAANQGQQQPASSPSKPSPESLPGSTDSKAVRPSASSSAKLPWDSVVLLDQKPSSGSAGDKSTSRFSGGIVVVPHQSPASQDPPLPRSQGLSQGPRASDTSTPSTVSTRTSVCPSPGPATDHPKVTRPAGIKDDTQPQGHLTPKLPEGSKLVGTLSPSTPLSTKGPAPSHASKAPESHTHPKGDLVPKTPEGSKVVGTTSPKTPLLTNGSAPVPSHSKDTRTTAPSGNPTQPRGDLVPKTPESGKIVGTSSSSTLLSAAGSVPVPSRSKATQSTSLGGNSAQPKGDSVSKTPESSKIAGTPPPSTLLSTSSSLPSRSKATQSTAPSGNPTQPKGDPVPKAQGSSKIDSTPPPSTLLSTNGSVPSHSKATPTTAPGGSSAQPKGGPVSKTPESSKIVGTPAPSNLLSTNGPAPSDPKETTSTLKNSTQPGGHVASKTPESSKILGAHPPEAQNSGRSPAPSLFGATGSTGSLKDPPRPLGHLFSQTPTTSSIFGTSSAQSLPRDSATQGVFFGHVDSPSSASGCPPKGSQSTQQHHATTTTRGEPPQFVFSAGFTFQPQEDRSTGGLTPSSLADKLDALSLGGGSSETQRSKPASSPEFVSCKSFGSASSSGDSSGVSPEEETVITSPEDECYTPYLHTAIQQGRDLAKALHDALAESGEARNLDFIARAAAEAQELALFKLPSIPRRVGFIGQESEGEHSLIYSMLHINQSLTLPVCRTSETVGVTFEYRHDPNASLHFPSIGVEYLTTHDLHRHIDELAGSYRSWHLAMVPETASLPAGEEKLVQENGEMQALQRKSILASSTFQLMFGRDWESRYGEELRDGRAEKCISSMKKCADESWQVLQQKKTVLFELYNRKVNVWSYENDWRRCDAEWSGWPFVEKIKIGVQSPVLGHEMVLVDLPEIQSLSVARARVAERHLADCQEVLVVCNKNGVESDKQLVRSVNLSKRLNPGQVRVICTHLDDIDQAKQEVKSHGAQAECVSFSDLLRQRNPDIARLERFIASQKEQARNEVLRWFEDQDSEAPTSVHCVSNTILIAERLECKFVWTIKRRHELSGIPDVWRHCMAPVRKARRNSVSGYIDSIQTLLLSIDLLLRLAKSTVMAHWSIRASFYDIGLASGLGRDRRFGPVWSSLMNFAELFPARKKSQDPSKAELDTPKSSFSESDAANGRPDTASQSASICGRWSGVEADLKAMIGAVADAVRASTEKTKEAMKARNGGRLSCLIPLLNKRGIQSDAEIEAIGRNAEERLRALKQRALGTTLSSFLGEVVNPICTPGESLGGDGNASFNEAFSRQAGDDPLSVATMYSELADQHLQTFGDWLFVELSKAVNRHFVKLEGDLRSPEEISLIRDAQGAKLAILQQAVERIQKSRQLESLMKAAVE